MTDLLMLTFTALLIITLTALAWQDINHMILPDYLNGILAITGVIQAIVLDALTLLEAGLGALLGIVLLGAVAFWFQRRRGYAGLGMGDIKFAGSAGLWIGWQGMPWMLLFASLTALVFVAVRVFHERAWDFKRPIPFGPFLCAGTGLSWLILIFGFSSS